MNYWIFEGEKINSINQIPKNAVAFTYTIVTDNGREYIGVKKLFHANNRVIGKRELTTISDKRKLNKRKNGKNKDGSIKWIYFEKRVKESNWLLYTGSNKYLNNDIRNKKVIVTKYINTFIFDNSMILYQETKELFANGVLEHGDKYYNDHILGKFYKKNIKK